MRLFVTLILVIALTNPASAKEGRPVPGELFGITLGEKYLIYPDGEPAQKRLPVRKGLSWSIFAGAGIHLYFEPLKDYSAFPYVEEEGGSSENQVTKSSFRLYLYPVIPENISSLEEMNEGMLLWEVALIEWSGELEGRDKYYWAMEMCELFAMDSAVEPEIFQHEPDDWYQCSFTDDVREFKVSSNFGPTVTLQFTREAFDEKGEAVWERRKRLRIEEIRPY